MPAGRSEAPALPVRMMAAQCCSFKTDAERNGPFGNELPSCHRGRIAWAFTIETATNLSGNAPVMFVGHDHITLTFAARRCRSRPRPHRHACFESDPRVDLILWRHAEAEPGEPDLGRRLTSKGLKQAERMGGWLDHQLPGSARILASPADRAQQTALGLKRKFRTVDDLAPGTPVAACWQPRTGPMRASPWCHRSPAHARCRGFVPARRRRSHLGRQERRGLVAFQPRPVGPGGRCSARGDRTGLRLIRSAGKAALLQSVAAHTL